jgi:hypothetical protein
MASQLQLMRSHDDGATWSTPQTLFNTEQASDHPLLVTAPHGVFLSWSSEEFGYLFTEISSDEK